MPFLALLAVLQLRRPDTVFTMSADGKRPFPDPLVRQVLFPEPAEVFGFAPSSLAEALKDGIVAVDTNVLLVPYTTGRASLEQIRSTYKRLTSENRIRIPAQVARGEIEGSFPAALAKARRH